MQLWKIVRVLLHNLNQDIVASIRVSFFLKDMIQWLREEMAHNRVVVGSLSLLDGCFSNKFVVEIVLFVQKELST